MLGFESLRKIFLERSNFLFKKNGLPSVSTNGLHVLPLLDLTFGCLEIDSKLVVLTLNLLGLFDELQLVVVLKMFSVADVLVL